MPPWPRREDGLGADRPLARTAGGIWVAVTVRDGGPGNLHEVSISDGALPRPIVDVHEALWPQSHWVRNVRWLAAIVDVLWLLRWLLWPLSPQSGWVRNVPGSPAPLALCCLKLRKLRKLTEPLRSTYAGVRSFTGSTINVFFFAYLYHILSVC